MGNLFLSLVIIASLYTIFLASILDARGHRKWLFFSLWMGLLVVMYLLNQNMRIYSRHGFLHAGIVYQILGNPVNPSYPILGGEPILYPWAYHVLAAGISSVFTISPFYSFAVINIFSLAVVILMIYRITGLLYPSERAGIIAVLLSFCSTFGWLDDILRRFPNSSIIGVGIPFWDGCSNINPMPCAFMCFLISTYCLMRFLFVQRSYWLLMLFFLSAIATGLIYPVYLVIIFALTLPAGFFILLENGKGRFSKRFLYALFLPGSLVLVLILLRPYLDAISAGYKQSHLIGISPFRDILRKEANVILHLSPFILFFITSASDIWSRVNRRRLFLLGWVVLVCVALYCLIHVPNYNEYKFLVLGAVLLGIPGGVAADFLLNRKLGWKITVLIALFLVFCALREPIRSQLLPNFSVFHRYAERGLVLESLDKQENEMFVWIRKHTSGNAVFFDTELNLPVCGQRQLFFPTSRGNRRGYTFKPKSLLRIYGYDPRLIAEREKIIDETYNPGIPLDESMLKWGLRQIKAPVYFVSRNQFIEKKFAASGILRRVFVSSDASFSTYEYVRQ